MTLEPYDPDRLDKMSLRVLDLCSGLRRLAEKSREEQLSCVELHDKKALEWLGKLEDWLHQAEGEVSRLIHRNHGERRAQQIRSARAK